MLAIAAQSAIVTTSLTTQGKHKMLTSYFLAPIALSVFLFTVGLIGKTLDTTMSSDMGVTLVISLSALGWVLGSMISLTLYL